MRDAARDGTAWKGAKHTTYLALTYPTEAIVEWFKDAGVPDPAEATDRVAADVAHACHAFHEERAWEGFFWKRGKATGLGNHELREHVAASGAKATEFGLSLYRLQLEASRPGQATTARGASVRALYRRIVDNLIGEIGAAADLDESDAPTLAKLRAHIDVDEIGYVGGAAAFEQAFIRHGRWCQSVARRDHFWKGLPEARSSTSPARDRWIKQLAACWERAALTPPTCTDAGGTSRPSGFVIFIACVHGHLAGLAEAKLVDREKANHLLSALGLRAIPSARTLRNILRRVENHSSNSEE